MKIIDLIHIIKPSMAVFPRLEKLVLIFPMSVEKDGCKMTCGAYKPKISIRH